MKGVLVIKLSGSRFGNFNENIFRHSHAKGSLQVMLTLSMIILHLAIPRKIGRQILTSFHQPTLLLAMGHAAGAARVSCAVQCVVDRLAELYLRLI